MWTDALRRQLSREEIERQGYPQSETGERNEERKERKETKREKR